VAKPQSVQVRLTDSEKKTFEAAADVAGLSLSSWVRERLRLAAMNELQAAGRAVPFLESATGDE
jgi:hypothetical protein